MNSEQRASILDSLAQLQERVRAAELEQASPVLSQGWVDRRRLLLVEQALLLAEGLIRDEAVGARLLAEQVQSLFEAASVLAPGHGMDVAAEAVLDSLAGEAELGVE